MLSNNDGFTFIELLITLVITSLLIIGISQGLISGTKIIEKATIKTESTTTYIEMDDLVRQMVGRIYMPFWLSDIYYEEEPGYMEIPYFDGKGDSFLTISFTENNLHVGIKVLISDDAEVANRRQSEYQTEVIRSFHAFSNIDIETALNAEQEVIGITLSVYPIDESVEPFTIVAPFGSNPLYSQN